MPERAYTERQTRGDRWREQMAAAVGNEAVAPRRIQRAVDAGIAMADVELAVERRKLLALRILLERQRDDATATMRRALSQGVQHHRAYALREAALEGLRILEREP